MTSDSRTSCSQTNATWLNVPLKSPQRMSSQNMSNSVDQAMQFPLPSGWVSFQWSNLQYKHCVVHTHHTYHPTAHITHPIHSVHPSYLTQYRSGTVNSKSFVGKDFLRIKWKFEFWPKFQIRIYFGLKLWNRNYFELILGVMALFDLILWNRPELTLK